MCVLYCIQILSMPFQYLVLCGDDLAATSYADLATSCSVTCLKSMTLSLLFRVALIYSSVYTNLSNSMLRSLFWFYSTAQCELIASHSDFTSLFLSRRLPLLNLRFSYSFLDAIICSSVFLSLVSLSKTSWFSYLFLASSFSAYLLRSFLCVSCPSRFL